MDYYTSVIHYFLCEQLLVKNIKVYSQQGVDDVLLIPFLSHWGWWNTECCCVRRSTWTEENHSGGKNSSIFSLNGHHYVILIFAFLQCLNDAIWCLLDNIQCWSHLWDVDSQTKISRNRALKSSIWFDSVYLQLSFSRDNKKWVLK